MNSSNYFKLFWDGNIKLWKSFWLVGELIYGSMLLIIIQLDKLFFKSSDINNQITFFYFNNLNLFPKIILLIVTVFISVGIWRSAENYKGNIIWILITFVYVGYRIFSLRLLFS
tara:strand:- start:90 stop:431 length:342 start_codon:yes stop_codon:yes gene_type:complete